MSAILKYAKESGTPVLLIGHINKEKNNAMFAKYQEEAEKNDKVIFCGRLADYKYYDMHVVIERALEVVEKEFIK